MDTAILHPQYATSPGNRSASAPTENIVEIRLGPDEHNWLYTLFTSEHNISPACHFSDLISACVTLSRQGDPTGVPVPRQAWINTAEQITRKTAPPLESTLS